MDGVDPLLAGLLEVDAEPEVVLDLDEQVGEPDRAAAGVSKTAIAKLTGVSRTALYSFMSSRGLRPSP